MAKEINEQPHAVADTLLGRSNEAGRLVLDEMRIDEAVLRSIDKIVVVACGTAAYAGSVARYAIEHWCRIPCEVELAHEFRYRDPVVNAQTLVVAISQSGETMDTIMAVRHARAPGPRVVAICNPQRSTIPRGRDSLHSKVVSNIQEINARGARTIVIAEEGDDEVVPFATEVIRVPATPTLLAPLVTVVPLQVFACELATAKGLDVDQPRNLAKSVTVE